MPAERPSWAPQNIDLERPNAARIYDYYLGGACNFEHDRDFAQKFLALMPDAELAARRNRAFLRRAVRFCVNAGIRQFLDLGSGIPTVGNVHEIAQEMAPESRIVYVDNEPVAVAHSELILEGNENAAIVQADLCDPDTILNSESTRRLLNFDEPMALLIVSVLHFVPDSAGPRAAIARYLDAMASGSYLVLSHGTSHGRDRPPREAAAGYERTTTPGVDRGRQEILSLMAGTELVEPGLVWTPQWRPDNPEDAHDHPERSLVLAGVGRKP
ncbi:MAG TPA: SAM-dependent methyltransferase [Actinophytocola sp.]|uniref:SAM-dependent methyltransferase n=1 Tax=Actinophytocola sp. TaxID=1872138 RepID=UPI002DDDB955|nr:SAM-dependent methyltransferase [Actinophytocola sp.]HEV2781725.1 SAM-dependent methyltransferase [Actinophytocola sp.]